MTEGVTEEDLRLDRASKPISSVEFSPWSVAFKMGDSTLALRAPFDITWADGSAARFDPTAGASKGDASRLLAEVLETTIVRSVAGVEHAYLRVEFASGLRIDFEPADTGVEEWEATNADGVRYIALPWGELESFGPAPTDASSCRPDDHSPPADEPDWYEGDEPRVIDLEISDHIYGITIFGSSVQLETRGGSIYLAGPFQVIDAAGEAFDFDPTKLHDDTVAGALLGVLIDREMGQVTLQPDTSELTVTLKSGAALRWKASSPAQAQFSAKLRNGRQFWSKGDGTIFWYGGPAGTRPNFLVGGPKRTDRTD